MAEVRIIQSGAVKPEGIWPYTLALIANPWIEAPQNSGQFVVDPIVADQAAFNSHVLYVMDSLFGRLAGQAETMLAPIADQFRVISIFDRDRPRRDANALVEHDNTNIVIARQNKFAPFLRSISLPGYGQLRADVAFAITASATHDRSSAWFTLDNDGIAGRPFTVDDSEMVHRPENLMPGVSALHIKASSLVGLHEFGHAASSWTNGMITDLYSDAGDGFNKRYGRPIAQPFCNYDGVDFAAATERGGSLRYPNGWTSYHPELADPDFPSAMDNFWEGAPPEGCRFDTLTQQFLLDRIETIMSR